LAVFLAATFVVPSWLSQSDYRAQVAAAQAAEQELQAAHDLSSAFKSVIKALQPSVVSIQSVQVIEPGQLPQLPFPFDLDEFFRPFGGGQGEAPSLPEQKRAGIGSGFIISDDGYIVTNNHVVARADEVRVKLSDEREYTAKVIGTDPRTDVALVKIDAEGLAPVTFGNSSQLEKGEWVLAIGNPFGLTQTVTAGIVSATGRGNVGIVDYGDFIQTDAAINPGNSGGPLVNLRGEVVGMNTAIFSRSGGNMGIGFAIPIDLVRQIQETLREEGRVVRGYLGVLIQDLTPELARSFRRTSAEGALVGRVMEGSPADQAGLRPGDIILSIGDYRVENSDSLRNHVANLRPGTEANLVVWRDGEERTLELTIGTLPTEEGEAGPPDAPLGNQLGLTLADRPTRRGDTEVIVMRVKPLSPADRAGLAAGDVILRVQDEEVASARDFSRLVRKHEEQGGARLLVRRGEQQIFVFLPLSD